jgi:hypothetical protein
LKVLYDNYLKGATITAGSEDPAYPVTNITHQFLEKKYQAIDGDSSSIITIDLGSLKTISLIAYGYNNTDGNLYNGVINLKQSATDGILLQQSAVDGIKTEQADYIDFFDASNVFTERKQVVTGEEYNFSYFTPLECRYIKLYLSADETLYLGGMAVGTPLNFEYLQTNPQLPLKSRDKPTRTDGGQLLPNSKPMLRKWTVVLPYATVTNEVRKQVLTMIKTIGSSTPVWADLWDGDTENLEVSEEPMYCNIIANSCRLSSTSRAYTIGLTLEECR